MITIYLTSVSYHRREPSSGAFITLAQFVVVAFVAMFEMLDMTLTKGSFSVAFKTRKIPIDRYFIWVCNGYMINECRSSYSSHYLY